MTAAVWSVLRTQTDLIEVNTAACYSSGARYHVDRFRRHGAAIGAMICRWRFGPRLVYATCPAGLGLWYVVVLAAVGRILGYDFIVHHHSYAYVDKQSLPMRVLVELAGRDSTHVLLCNDMRARFERAYHPPGTMIVCSNAAWVPEGQQRSPTNGAPRIRLGYLGRLTADKGLEDVFRTFRGLLDLNIDAVLHLAGPMPRGNERRTLEERQAEFTWRLDVHGVTLGAQKDEFFANIDAFLFPTQYRHEAEPLVVLEALAAGATVVAYGRGCIACMFGGRAGLVVDPKANFVDKVVPHLAKMAASREGLRVAQAAALATFDQHRSRALAERSVLLESIIRRPSAGRDASGDTAPG